MELLNLPVVPTRRGRLPPPPARRDETKPPNLPTPLKSPPLRKEPLSSSGGLEPSGSHSAPTTTAPPQRRSGAVPPKKRKRPANAVDSLPGSPPVPSAPTKYRYPKERKDVLDAVRIGDQDPHRLMCFMDGSAKGNPGKAGAAAVLIPFHTKSISPSILPLLPVTKAIPHSARQSFIKATNNLAEIVALELGLRLLRSHHLPHQTHEWHLWTDSRYVRGVMVLGWNRNEHIERLSALDALWRDCITSSVGLKSITLHWTPGHDKVAGNELADELASRSALDQDVPTGRGGGGYNGADLPTALWNAYEKRDRMLTSQLAARVTAQHKWDEDELLSELKAQFHGHGALPLPLFQLSLSYSTQLFDSELTPERQKESIYDWAKEILAFWQVATKHDTLLQPLQSTTVTPAHAALSAIHLFNDIVWKRALSLAWFPNTDHG